MEAEVTILVVSYNADFLKSLTHISALPPSEWLPPLKISGVHCTRHCLPSPLPQLHTCLHKL